VKNGVTVGQPAPYYANDVLCVFGELLAFTVDDDWAPHCSFASTTLYGHAYVSLRMLAFYIYPYRSLTLTAFRNC